MPLTVWDDGSLTRKGANVFASAKVPSMSLPPRTGVTGRSLTFGFGLGAACCWQATTTTIASTSPRTPLTTSVSNASRGAMVQGGSTAPRWGYFRIHHSVMLYVVLNG